MNIKDAEKKRRTCLGGLKHFIKVISFGYYLLFHEKDR
jgi:hypothetical protein